MKFTKENILPVLIVLICLVPLNSFAQRPLNVHVGILPLKYFVEKIGRDRVKVSVLLKPGKSPATYSPSPDQMRQLALSDIYFRIGLPFENSILHRMKSITGAEIVDTRQGIVLREMDEHLHDKEHPDDEGPDKKKPVKVEHDKHTKLSSPDSSDHDTSHFLGKDPHVWMSPVIVKTQAHTIFTALSDLDPEGSDVYKTNLDQFVKDLDELHSKLETALREFRGENLFVFHPSFGYFTDAYGLKQVAIETMGKTPKGKTLSRIIKLARKQKARVIFVQPQFDRNAARKIASAINGAVAEIDPLAYDYPANMENIADTITRALKK